MVLNVPCKINLGLHVLRRRPDGYHDIETVMYPIPLFDVLTIEKAAVFSFCTTGLTIGGSAADNLCLKAFRLLEPRILAGSVSIHLQKNIPMGAGLGGGSADAAYTLLAVNELFELGLTVSELHEMASRLGSDCPFFITSQVSLATGRGEILHPLHFSLRSFWLAVIKPSVSVSTREAYSGVTPAGSYRDLAQILRNPVESWRYGLVNDFEPSVVGLYPEIKTIKETLYAQGAVYASMSGSGSAVFGLFTDKPDLNWPRVNDFIEIMRLT